MRLGRSVLSLSCAALFSAGIALASGNTVTQPEFDAGTEIGGWSRKCQPIGH